jgi:hypothetical protein
MSGRSDPKKVKRVQIEPTQTTGKRKPKGNPVMETFVREHMRGLVEAVLKAGLDPWTIIRLNIEAVRAAFATQNPKTRAKAAKWRTVDNILRDLGSGWSEPSLGLLKRSNVAKKKST